jgi:hypothetical protein
MVDTFLSIITAYGPWIFFGLFVLAIAGWEMWQFRIRPMLIPKTKIDAMVDALIARYGPDAEEMTYGEEDRAWRYSDTFKQGVLRRVRRELWRRYDAGEWE